MLEKLRQLNPNFQILTVSGSNPLFQKVDGDFSEIVKLSKKLEVYDANSYIANDCDFQETAIVKQIERDVFGELKVQAGWCYGGNPFMNGMEWHKSSEVVIACTDAVLLLGRHSDIANDIYDSTKAVGLYLKSGEAVELKPMTLHLAPLPVDEFFKVAIILPEGTNLPLKNGIKGTLRAVNKWLLVHPENLNGIKMGGKIGVTGENIRLKK